jgi:hypothetical protein
VALLGHKRPQKSPIWEGETEFVSLIRESKKYEK